MRHLVYTTLMLLILANSVLFSQTQDSTHLTSTDTTFVYKPQTARNNFYLELGGAGLLGAVSYERIWGEAFCTRLGIANNMLSLLTYPIPFYFYLPTIASVSYLINDTEYKFELGIGVWLYINNQLNPFGIIGYRYQPKNGGFVFRASFTPLQFPSLRGEPPTIGPWAGVSFGINF